MSTPNYTSFADVAAALKAKNPKYAQADRAFREEQRRDRALKHAQELDDVIVEVINDVQPLAHEPSWRDRLYAGGWLSKSVRDAMPATLNRIREHYLDNRQLTFLELARVAGLFGDPNDLAQRWLNVLAKGDTPDVRESMRKQRSKDAKAGMRAEINKLAHERKIDFKAAEVIVLRRTRLTYEKREAQDELALAKHRVSESGGSPAAHEAVSEVEAKLKLIDAELDAL